MTSRTLGDYQVNNQIGHGALGTVYAAEHRFLKKPMMLKVLPEELAGDRAFLTRFQEEVTRLATLDHPNIVKIHNVSSASGLFFLVSDPYVDTEGETTNLAQYLLANAEPLPREVVSQILTQVASALDYAHQMGVVHAGLKLNNILIGPTRSPITVSLCDFGLTRIVGEGAVLTRTYRLVAEATGVPPQLSQATSYVSPQVERQKLSPLHHSFVQGYAFMAPEQRAVEREGAIEPSTDVYAFGVLAYRLLMGQYPEGYFELPSERGLPVQWDGLIRSCLDVRPARRPTNLLAALEFPVVDVPVAPTDFVVRQEPRVREMAPTAAVTVEPKLTETVTIPSGIYVRGSNDGSRDEMPRHTVELDEFNIDVYPVTNEQFARFLETNGSEKDAKHNDIIRLKDSRIKRHSGKLSIESGYAKHPVVGVTWYGAAAYARWVGRRLPTEAEWEAAAKGGDDLALYPTGANIEKTQANFFSSDTTAVGSYAPNDSGLYDMAGNVYEWCADWYSTNYYETSVTEPNNPKGPSQGVYRSLRGGCWKSLKEDLRASRRHRNNPGTVLGTYGFRTAG